MKLRHVVWLVFLPTRCMTYTSITTTTTTVTYKSSPSTKLVIFCLHYNIESQFMVLFLISHWYDTFKFWCRTFFISQLKKKHKLFSFIFWKAHFVCVRIRLSKRAIFVLRNGILLSHLWRCVLFLSFNIFKQTNNSISQIEHTHVWFEHLSVWDLFNVSVLNEPLFIKLGYNLRKITLF